MERRESSISQKNIQISGTCDATNGTNGRLVKISQESVHCSNPSIRQIAPIKGFIEALEQGSEQQLPDKESDTPSDSNGGKEKARN